MGRKVSGVYKRNNRWVAQPLVKYPNGTKKRIFLKADTYDEIVRKKREAEAEAEKQNPCAKGDWTVAEYLDYWLYDVKQEEIRESTLSGYRDMINLHLKPVMGNHKLSKFNEQNAQYGIDQIKKNGFAGSVAHKCCQILVSCLRHAAKKKDIPYNIAEFIDRPKYKPGITMIWTAEQTSFFLKSVKEHPQYIAFLLLLTCGMRRGEVLGIRWCDIDFENDNIYVRQQIFRINGAIKVGEPKTESSFRVIPISPDIRAALFEHAAKNNIEIPPFEPFFKMSLEGTIVKSKAGTPIEPRNLQRCFQNLSAKLGLPIIKVHASRHFAATNFKDVGMHIKDAADILGHSKPETTLKIYQHSTTKAQRAGMSAASKRLRAA